MATPGHGENMEAREDTKCSAGTSRRRNQTAARYALGPRRNWQPNTTPLKSRHHGPPAMTERCRLLSSAGKTQYRSRTAARPDFAAFGGAGITSIGSVGIISTGVGEGSARCLTPTTVNRLYETAGRTACMTMGNRPIVARGDAADLNDTTEPERHARDGISAPEAPVSEAENSAHQANGERSLFLMHWEPEEPGKISPRLIRVRHWFRRQHWRHRKTGLRDD